MPDAAPVPQEAIADAEARVLNRATAWIEAGAVDDRCRTTAVALAARRKVITSVLEAGAWAIRAAALDQERERRIAQNDPSALLIVKAVDGGFCGGWLENGDTWDGCLHDPHGNRQDALRCAEMRLDYGPAASDRR